MSSPRSKSGLLMATELREAPDVVRRQSDTLARPLTKLAALLINSQPRMVVTCARGSSANAATFGKYLIERHLGIPVAEAAPSIMSVYRKGLRLEGQLFLAISQSGRSEDLIESASRAKGSGAITVALSTFDSTVSRSETGSDFQNSTLRSLRSSYRLPRQ